ncbi:MAG TPA: LapA family protein [Opitutus sp.]|nr:LapA family protein [Opitutus sp.]
MKFTWITVVLLLVFVAVFSVQNAEPITVHFLAWEITMSAALVIQLAALIGALVGLAAGAASRRTTASANPPLPTTAETAQLTHVSTELPPNALTTEPIQSNSHRR